MNDQLIEGGGGYMIIDCHMHYEPAIFPLERMLSCMESHNIAKTALIAAMVDPFSISAKVHATGELMRAALVHANPLGQFMYRTTVTKKGYFTPVGEKYRIHERPDNAEVADVIARHPDKFMGWIFINPALDDDPVAEIEKWASNPAMVGVKSHPHWHMYPVERLDGAAGWCREHGYPLLIHLGPGHDRGDYERLPEKYPGLKILYAHAGIPFYRRLWAYIKDKKDVYIDLSCPPYLNQTLVHTAIDFLGSDKCLYGNDGPYGRQRPGEDFDYGEVKGWIESLPLKDSELQKIFHENFEAIRKR